MTKTKFIAFTGYARSGKDSFSSEFKKQIEAVFPEKTVKIYSFASGIRKEIDTFLIDNFKISAWTEITKEKDIIRPILIGYGNAKRKMSENKYWIELLEKEIARDNPDIAIISDLRFAENETDELGWLKSKNGFLANLKRTKLGKETDAPNEFEKENNPKLREASDVVLEIEIAESDSQFYEIVSRECKSLIEKNLSRFV